MLDSNHLPTPSASLFDEGFLEGQASRDEEVLALEARVRDLERRLKPKRLFVSRAFGWRFVARRDS